MNHNDNPIKVIKTEGSGDKLFEDIGSVLMKQRELAIGVRGTQDKIIAVAFAEWIFKNRYQRYWGSDNPNNDKWYIQYTHANRNYFTTEQLFDIFIKEYKP